MNEALWTITGVVIGIVIGLVVGYVALLWYFNRNNPM